MNKILITGINGMLGSTLYDVLNSGNSIAGVHRNEKCFNSEVKDFSIDLTNTTSVNNVVDSFGPDVIIHCASMINMEQCESNPDLAYRNNVLVTRILAQSCNPDCIFVYISSDQVYGDIDNKSEDINKLEQLNEYGKTKYLGECEVLENVSDYIIARTNIFGWNVNKKISSAEWMYYELINNHELNLFTDYNFSPIYTRYFGKTLDYLMFRKFRGIINIGSIDTCSKYNFGINMCEKLDLNKDLINKASILERQLAVRRSTNLSMDISKLETLGIPVFSWKESLDGFIKDRKLCKR